MLRFGDRLRFWLEHRWAPGRMSDYVDGGLPDSDRERLEHHTSRCPQCRRLLRTLLTLVEELPSLRRPARPGAGDAILATVRDRLAHEHSPPPGDRPA